MIEHVCKMLKITEQDVIFYDPVEKFLLVRIGSCYSVLKMVSLLKPELNKPDYSPTNKEIKKYFPFVIRVSETEEYARQLYNMLTADTSNYD